jgi:hypothetical protein
MNGTWRRSRREREARVYGASRAAWSEKKFAESQTDSPREHAARACENGHVKKTGTVLANASIIIIIIRLNIANI